MYDDQIRVDDIVCRFLNECINHRCLDDKTIRAYVADLRQFADYMDGKSISRDSIAKYIEFLNQNYKPSTVKRKIACVRSSFSYAEYEGLVDQTPFHGMRIQIRQPSNLPRSLTLKEMATLIKYNRSKVHQSSDNPEDYKKCIRDATIFELMFATGIRVSELCSINYEDVDIDSGQILIHGKGSRERMVLICNTQVISIMIEYISLFDGDLKIGGPFMINKGKRITDQYVRRKLHNISGECLKREVTPHMIRHSFATLLLEEGVDTRYIQKAMGHSSIQTTQRYLFVSDSRQRAIMSEKHPRNRIDFDD